MTSIVIADPLPPGEWDRYPASLAEDAYRDGWTQRLGGAPATYPRQLNSGELTAWTRGHAAAHRSTACVRVVGEPLRPPAPVAPEPDDVSPAGAVVAVAVSETPAVEDEAALLAELLELIPPPPPVAPFFDGTQVCAQVDPEQFFPENGGHADAAKELCTTCEFRAACLAYALNERINGMPISGIWGGTSEPQRRALRRAGITVDLVLEVDVDQLLALEVA